MMIDIIIMVESVSVAALSLFRLLVGSDEDVVYCLEMQ